MRGSFTNTRQLRDEDDEAELKALEKERTGEQDTTEEEDKPVVKPDDVDPKAPVVANQEEETWKKRYGDLRRYADKIKKDAQKELDDLRAELRKAQESKIVLPKSDEELEAFAQEYPDLYNVLETVAAKNAASVRAELEEVRRQKAEEQLELQASIARNKLLKRHPDLDDLQTDEKFGEWLESPTTAQWIKKALLENATDWETAADALDLYKARHPREEKKPKQPDLKDAAKQVAPGSKPNTTLVNDDGMIRESEISKMSVREFEKNLDRITKAQREGKIIYDMQKAASR